MKPHAVLLALGCLAALGCPPADEAPSPASGPASPSLTTIAARLVVEADTGKPGPTLLPALQDPTSPHYLRALRLARPLGDALLDVAGWTRALHHTRAAVRAEAAAGLAARGLAEPEPVLRALASESDPRVRVALLRALASSASPKVAPALQTALELGSPRDVGAACLAAGTGSLPAAQIPHATLARHLSHVDAGVRVACAFGLAMAPVPADDAARRSLAADLSAALAQSDPELRLLAAKGLQRYPAPSLDALQAATLDADWRVAGAAFRALAVHAAPPRYLDAIEQLARSVLEDPASLRGGGLRIWEAAMRAAASRSDQKPGVEAAARWLDRLAEAWLEQPSPRLAAAHCEVASWLDHGRHWPRSLRSCGDGQALALSLHHEAALVASQPGKTALRASYLRRMLRRGPEARVPVLDAVSRVRHASLASAILPLLSSKSAADVGRAAQSLVHLAPAVPRTEHHTRDALQTALRQAATRLQERASVSTLLALIDAARALDLLGFAPTAQALTHHPSPDVRRAARAFLETIPDLAAQPTAAGVRPRPLDPSAVPRQPVRLELRLPEGRVVIQLSPQHAPASIARLMQAVSAGWLRDAPLLPLTRRLQLRIGDPYASLPPGVRSWIPREPSNQRFERGSVGLVRAAEDSSSLVPFVTFSRQPDLDGGPTWIGRVVQGLEHLEGALHGQTVLEAGRANGD